MASAVKEEAKEIAVFHVLYIVLNPGKRSSGTYGRVRRGNVAREIGGRKLDF